MADQDFDNRLRSFLAEATSKVPAPGLEQRILHAEAPVGTVDRVRALIRAPHHALASAVAGGVMLLVLAAFGVSVSQLAARRTPPPVSAQPPSPVATPSTSSSPSPAPAPDYGTPPAGGPLIYVVDPRNRGWLQALDWSGHFVGTVKLPNPLAVSSDGRLTGAVPSGDGSRIVVGGQEFDRAGKPTATVDSQLVDRSSAGYADDNAHLCGIRDFDSNQRPNGPFGQILFTLLPGSPGRDTARFTLEGLGQVGYRDAACSFKANRAVVVKSAVFWPTDWWLVRISDGAIVQHKTFANEYLSTVIATENGAYVAENPGQAKPDPGLTTAPYTIIRRTSDGAQVGRLDSWLVDMFSGDGSLALVYPKESPSYTTGSTRIIDWRTGKVIWTRPPGRQLDAVLALPGGRDFALAFSAPDQQSPPACGQTTTTACATVTDPLRDVVIVHADGTTTNVPGRYHVFW